MTQTQAAIDARYLEVLPQWLRSLGEDVAAVGGAIEALGPDDEATRALVAGVNYVFKSLDLIPDGIEDLGFLDDAFVIRVSCSFAVAARPELNEGVLAGLAADARAVHEFLGDDYARLEAYVKGARKGAARGRTVEEIVVHAPVRQGFLDDLRAWSAAYQVPRFTRDPKTLVKLKAFLSAKLS
ncbi:MAG: YkvA family protein [Polyangiaceae bacterium]|jgi:uncharacterized membrane protein YkvA (DUF1232 family)